jgi:signal transduction protein with GAF and PtsI domain
MSSVENIEPVEVKLSKKQKYIQSQLDDLRNKEERLMFQLDQIKAAQQVFNQAFVEASKEVAEEVLDEEETKEVN